MRKRQSIRNPIAIMRLSSHHERTFIQLSSHFVGEVQLTCYQGLNKLQRTDLKKNNKVSGISAGVGAYNSINRSI